MAVTLGKRKRISREELGGPSKSPSQSSSEESGEEDIQDIFRRAFEAKFQPLDPEPKKKTVEDAILAVSEEEEEESDWEGISDEEEIVEVVDHSFSRTANDRISKQEARALLSSKPPSAATGITTKSKQAAPGLDDDTEALNVKNDIALQRLLQESHLLSPSSGQDLGLDPSGANRHKALDMRLQALGAKKSIIKQANMPMSHRKGILAKAAEREGKRRKEAKDNGVILEKAMKVKKAESRRERGVGGPTVGRFKGGTLTLSRKDISSITGPKTCGKGKKGKR